jgi:hypothetical protein
MCESFQIFHMPSLIASSFLICFSSAGREAEHVSSPWGESSPEELRFGSLTYSDPRERERDQHDKNKR